MRRDYRRQERRSDALAGSRGTRTRRDRTSALTVEALEQRQLLSLYQGPTRSRAVFSNNAFYQVSITGGGFEQLSQVGSGHHKIIGITLFGTTSSSQLNITLKSTLGSFGTSNTDLQIGKINVVSGLLGSINAAGAADLVGNVTPLQNSVQTISFNTLGPNAQVIVQGSVGTFQTGDVNLSANGLVNITGDVTGTFSASSVNLTGGKVLIGGNADGGVSLGGLNISQSGQFLIGNNLDGTSTLGVVDINGGRFLVTHNINGTVTTNDFLLQNAGQFIVGNDATGTTSTSLTPVTGTTSQTQGTSGSNSSATTTTTTNSLVVPATSTALDLLGSAQITSNGILQVGDDLAGLTVENNLKLDSTGKLVIGTDITGPIDVGAGVTISNNALLSVGRDIDGAAAIIGNLSLDSGGSISVGRSINSLSIGGSLLFTPSAGTITVQGNVAGLTINGIYQGRANTNMASPEFIVGLNLTDPTVLGGAAEQGAIENANISVGKDITGMNVAHGIFNSLITAGVLIDGTPQNMAAGGNVGPDGTDAIFDSQILAGVEINNFQINGSVDSDWVRNPTPTGLPTRIIAGENRQGAFASGGLIDNFQITGALIDSVLAASVQPYGGDGTLPSNAYGETRTPAVPPGPGVPTNYNAPAGTVEVGSFPLNNPSNTFDPNYSYLSYANETLIGTAFNTAIDPNIHVNILPGAINPSFASTPLPSSVTGTGVPPSSGGGVSVVATTSFLAIPTKSTVLGGVISTTHGGNPDGNDFAGIFAADTSGVFVGVLPNQAAAGSI